MNDEINYSSRQQQAKARKLQAAIDAKAQRIEGAKKPEPETVVAVPVLEPEQDLGANIEVDEDAEVLVEVVTAEPLENDFKEIN